MITLRDYQRDAVEAIRDAYINRGIRRPLVVLPTGAGKTVTFASLIRRRRQSGRALVIAHREELLTQAADKIGMVAPDLQVGTVRANRDEHQDVDVIVASIQTLARPKRLAPIIGTVSTVIIDEAHHAAARTYLEVMEALGCFDDDGPLTVGVTATAGRADRVGLKAAWEEIVYQRGILQMITDGYLCDIRALQVNADIDYAAVSTHRGDFTDGSLGAAMEDSGAVEAAAVAYKRYAADRPGVAFTPTIATAEVLADELNQRGITSEHLSGNTKRAERAEILRRLSTGDTQVVTNAAVLTEGFDEPSVSCVLIARPTRSATLFTQMAGRGLRPYPGKPDCLLLTVAGPPESGLATIANLSGKAPGEQTIEPKEGESLADAAERVEMEKLAFGGRSITSLTARQVSLFGRSGLRWVPVGDSFALPAGDAMLIVRPTGEADRWRAIVAPRAGETRTLHAGLSLEYAQGIAEEFARGTRARLARVDAPWRSRPASDAQRRELRRRGITASPETSGEASDLIATHAARQTIARIDLVGVAA